MKKLWRSDRTFDMPLRSPPILALLGEGTYGVDATQRTLRYEMGDVWCAHFYTYEGELVINGEEFPIRPNYVSVTPPLARLEWRLRGKSEHRAAIFSLPKAEEDTVVPEVAPAMRDLGGEFERVYAELGEGIGFLSLQRRRAEARVWDILWRLVEDEGLAAGIHGEAEAVDSRVLKTIKLIERRMGMRLSVPSLAAEVGLGVNQLERVFRKRLNTSIIGYIRRRRAERARELLLNTSMPIKLVAAEVGVPDLQSFYKTMRLEFGVAPGAIRKGVPASITRTS